MAEGILVGGFYMSTCGVELLTLLSSGSGLGRVGLESTRHHRATFSRVDGLHLRSAGSIHQTIEPTVIARLLIHAHL